MELTARDRSFMLPLLLVVVIATIVARTLDPRSIYDARLTDLELVKQIEDRRPAST
jgi:H+/Cl- antiporter ClcA